MLRYRLMLVFSLLAVSVAGLVVVRPSPAAAGSAWACPTNHTCIWEHKDFNGSMIGYADRANGSCLNVSGWWNDRMTSYHARTSHYIIFWADPNCRGDQVHIGPWRRENINNEVSNFNDRLSSISW